MPAALFDHPYVAIITKLLDEGATIAPLGSFALETSSVYLRHDVELSLPSALRIATLERQLDTSATYLFTLRSPFFNLLSSAALDIVAGIHELGHEVGLHHVPHGPVSAIDLESEINMAAEILPGFNENLVSIHAPQSLTDPAFSCISRHLEGVYGPLWRDQAKYISDSSGEWRGSGIADILDANSDRPVHLLMHPYWWDVGPRTPAERRNDLERLLSGATLDDTRTLRAFLPRLGRM